MLSIEDPSSDPSCFSKASDLAACHEAPNFSIRDYVFKSRIKDIRINWPFPGQLLQLCLGNDIRDVLPPFESSSLVRAHCFKKEVEESVQLLQCSENKQILENEQHKEDIELVVSTDLSQHSLSERMKEFKVHQDNKQIRSESKINAFSVKLCNHTETSSRPEGLQVSSLATAADLMASKICPVCKSFTSSSNTTLNAHIDQCLSSDQSNTAMDVTECLKPRLKPRKKRLMVDIYTTAPHCTLEELDKRNDTNWATDLSLVAPASDTNFETKRMNIPMLEAVSRRSVGDIYVDSNGTKLLILSSFDDLNEAMLRKNLKLKKNGKVFKKPRTSCSKFMKDNPQKKKLRVIKGFKDQIEATSETDNIAEAHQGKDESLSRLLSAQDQVKNSEPNTLGRSICSKRSDLSEKLNGKDICKESKKMVVNSRKLSVRLNQPDLGNSFVERSCALDFSQSSEAMASSRKTKGLNVLSDTQRAMDSAKKSSSQPSNFNSVSDGRMGKVSSTHHEIFHPSLKARRCSTSKKSTFSISTLVSLETRKVAKSNKLRSISGCAKWLRGEKYSIRDEGRHGSTNGFNLMSSRGDDTNKDDHSNFSENQEKRSAGTTDPMTSTATVVPASDNNTDPSPEEHKESISRSRYDSQIESPSQRSVHNQEVQFCRNEISNEIISQDIQVAGEPEPMLHHVDFQTDYQENSSTTSVKVKSIQDHNMAVDMDPSGSSVSTVSAICSPSIEDDRHMEAEQEKLSSRTVKKHNKVKLSSLAREPSCSCSHSLSRESQLTNHIGKKMASNLFIKTSTDLSSIQPGTSLEWPTESVVTIASSKSASNPILRLMGKDLVLSKKEPVPLPEILLCDSDYSSRAKFISFGLPSHGSFSYNGYYHYPIQSTANHQIPLQPPLQRKSDKFSPSSQCSIDKEVIVIDDDLHELGVEPRRSFTSLPRAISSANVMASQRVFSCFPSRNPYALRSVSFRQGASSEGFFMFPSPSSLFFSTTHR